MNVREALKLLLDTADPYGKYGFTIGIEEYERAKAALAQSDAEPVAWRYRYKIGGWSGWHVSTLREEIDLELRSCIVPIEASEIEPLYTIPPRPDASAGLIEALEWISKSNVYDMNTLHPDGCARVAAEALKAFRARPTDRSNP